MSVAVTVATMDRVGLITASAAIRAGSMESAATLGTAAAEAADVGTPAAEAAAVATAAAGKGATATAAPTSAARIGADRSERQGARHEKYGYCSLD